MVRKDIFQEIVEGALDVAAAADTEAAGDIIAMIQDRTTAMTATTTAVVTGQDQGQGTVTGEAGPDPVIEAEDINLML